MIFSGYSLPAGRSSKHFYASSYLNLKFCKVGHIIVPIYRWHAETLSASVVCTAIQGHCLGALPPHLPSEVLTKLRSLFISVHLCFPNIMPSAQWVFSCPIKDSTMVFLLSLGRELYIAVSTLRIIAKKKPSNVFFICCPTWVPFATP